MSVNENMHIASTMKNARNTVGITQEQLAERIGVSARHIMNLEGSQNMPSATVLFRIIRELNIDPNLIFFPEKTEKESDLADLVRMIYRCDDRSTKIIRATVLAALDSQGTNDHLSNNR